MAIPTDLLNSSVNIYRFQSSPAAPYGMISQSIEKIANAIKMRICRNSRTAAGVEDTGVTTIASHKAFCQVGVDVQEGDWIMNRVTRDVFKVLFVNKYPGGKSDSHYELDLVSIEEGEELS